MSITLRFTHRVDGVLTDVTSAVLSDPTGTYGVKRDDTGATVVADGTAMTKTATGRYSHTFTEPAAGLTYTYYVEWVYGGETYQVEFSYIDGARVVTLAEAKLHLRVDDDEEDTLIERLIDTAISWCEKYQGRKYLTQTCVDYLDSWPKVIRPRYVPLVAVSSIQYIDTDGTLQTWDPAEYDVDTDSELGRVALAYGCSYPDLRGDINGVVVTYTAGYGTQASDVPEEIRNAILLLVGHWYANREAVMQGAAPHEIPLGVKSLLGLERMVPI